MASFGGGNPMSDAVWWSLVVLFSAGAGYWVGYTVARLTSERYVRRRRRLSEQAAYIARLERRRKAREERSGFDNL